MSQIWSAIRGLEGVDDKLFGDPGVVYLSSVLEEDEVPEALAAYSRLAILVATDRRIIVVNKSYWGDKVKEITSYPYDNIHGFRVDMGLMSIGCQMTLVNGETKTLAIDKRSRERFANAVCLHLPRHQVSNVSSPPTLDVVQPSLLRSTNTAPPSLPPKGTDNRDLLDEVNYLSGCVFAHDVAITHLAKILIEAGVIEQVGLEAIIDAMERSVAKLPIELNEGYLETLQKMRRDLSGSS